MSQLPLLRFKPLLKQYLWGGRRLAELGKPLGTGEDYAESWEVADHGTDQSVVVAGEFAGVTLSQLVADHGRALFGRHHPQQRFPLLFKFLDAQKKLSVQVHPNDMQGARLDPSDLGKTEAWVVIDCQPGATLYAGLKRGFDRPALERELTRGTCELCLNEIEVKPGECVFLPAGTVHAIGEGILLAEIQQSSDTTYRLFDWNRVGPDGQPRQLHIAQALDVIDFDRGPVSPQTPLPADCPEREQLVECDKFVMDRVSLSGSREGSKFIGGDDRFHLLAVLGGSLAVSADNGADDARRIELNRGDSALLPACAGQIEIVTTQPSSLLDIFLP